MPWIYEALVISANEDKKVRGTMPSGCCYITLDSQSKGKMVIDETLKKKVINDEVAAFIKVIKANEYKIVEQMGKTPTQISLFALLLNYEPHREALLKVLKEARVSSEITTRQAEDVVGSVFSKQISFTDKELGLDGNGLLKALYIVYKCKGFVVARVMVDNSSTLNVCVL